MTSKIAVIDSETNSLRPDRRAWEVALILPGHPSDGYRVGSHAEVEPGRFRWFVDAEDLDLGNADPFSLRIGRFYERHPQFSPDAGGYLTSEADMLRQVERLTRGAHILGAVPDFDADVLRTRMRANGIAPSFHYHLMDIEAVAVGYLHGIGYAAEFPQRMQLPWKSDELSRACGVEPPSDEERHSALGDADWALRWWSAITGGRS